MSYTKLEHLEKLREQLLTRSLIGALNMIAAALLWAAVDWEEHGTFIFIYAVIMGLSAAIGMTNLALCAGYKVLEEVISMEENKK